MYVIEVTREIVDGIIKNCTHDFAKEAYRYNTEIENWDNTTLLLVDDKSVVQGMLYYRHVADNISQVINVFSNITCGGTTLFEYFNENIGKDFTYLYMSDKALGFYEKFNLVPNEAEKPSKEFQFCMYNTKSLIMEYNHNFIKTKI